MLYQDDRVLVVDKPAGVTTIPDRMGEPGLQQTLEDEHRRKLWVVHRLDREVGGALVFALDAEAHRRLSMAFERHEVGKGYAAITEGRADVGATFRWSNLLLRGKKRSYESPHGKSAITEASVTGAADGWLRWRLDPLTGRNHQLRVHLSQHGFPIVGDALYGATAAWKDGIALRSVRLVLPLPDGPREITAAPPWEHT